MPSRSFPAWLAGEAVAADYCRRAISAARVDTRVLVGSFETRRMPASPCPCENEEGVGLPCRVNTMTRQFECL